MAGPGAWRGHRAGACQATTHAQDTPRHMPPKVGHHCAEVVSVRSGVRRRQGRPRARCGRELVRVSPASWGCRVHPGRGGGAVQPGSRGGSACGGADEDFRVVNEHGPQLVGQGH